MNPINISWELALSIVINIVAIAYFMGKNQTTQDFLKTSIQALEKNIAGKIENLKENIDEKIQDIKEHTRGDFDRLEKKQDKHNNLIERMAKVEESSKSAHHRIDGMEV